MNASCLCLAIVFILRYEIEKMCAFLLGRIALFSNAVEKSNENPAGEYLTPCTEYPNCPHCPPRLTSDPPNEEYTCVKCHSKRMSLWDVPTPSLKAPDVCLDDFKKTLEHSHSSVSPEELERFVEWTHQFGQEGV